MSIISYMPRPYMIDAELKITDKKAYTIPLQYKDATIIKLMVMH